MTGSEQIKPIEDVRGISAVTYGFMASKALFAALDFDLFTHIARGIDTSPALAKATGIPENRLVTLLTALKSVGRAFDALPPDGLVLVHDFMVDDVREHPAFAALVSSWERLRQSECGVSHTVLRRRHIETGWFSSGRNRSHARRHNNAD
jgi:hypothetical protein